MKLIDLYLKRLRKDKAYVSFLFTVFLSFCLTYMFVVSVIGQSINNLQSKGCLRYGSFSGVLFSVKKEHLESLEKYGYDYETFRRKEDIVKIKGDRYSIGSFEYDTIEKIGLKIIKGSWQADNDAVAITEHLSSTYDLMVGDTILTNGGTMFKISGIVNNYFSYWNAPHNIVTGVNDYPEIICIENNNKNDSLNVFMYKESIPDESEIYDIGMKLCGDDNHFAINEHMLNDVYSYIDACNNVKTVILVFLLMSFLIMNCCVIKMHLKHFEDIDIVISNNGAKYFTLIIINWILLTFIKLIAVFASLFVYSIISIALNDNLTVTKDMYIFGLILMIGSILDLLIIIIDKYTDKDVKKGHFTIRETFEKSLGKYMVRRKIGSLSPVIVMAASLMVLTVLVSYVMSETISMNSDGFYDYELNAYPSRYYMEYDRFSFMENRNNAFSYDEVVEIESEEGISFLYKRPDYEQASIISDDGALEQYYQYPMNNEKSTDITNGIRTINDYNIFVINKYNIQLLHSSYPEIFTAEESDINGTVLFVPPDSDNNTFLRDHIIFAKLLSEGNFEETNHDTSLLYLEEYNIEIDKIIYDDFVLGKDGTILLDSQLPTFLIPEKVIRGNHLFNGIDEIKIMFSNDVTDNQKTKIKERIDELLSAHPGSYCFSLDDRLKDEEEYISSMLICTIVVVLISLLYTLVSIFIIAELGMIKNLSFIKVLVLQGFEKNQMFYAIGYEYVIYIVLTVLLGLLGITVLALLFGYFNILFIVPVMILSVIYLAIWYTTWKISCIYLRKTLFAQI